MKEVIGGCQLNKRVTNTLKVILGVFLLLLAVSFVFPSQEVNYGWVEITDKKLVDDKYYLQANLGEKPIEIVLDKTDTFTYESKPGETAEVTFSQVWDVVKTNKKYFVRIETNLFRSDYELEKLYRY